MSNIQVRRKSSGAITAVRFKRERPDLQAIDEFHSDIAPSLGSDSAALRFLGRNLTFEDVGVGGWCTVWPR